MLRPVAEGRTDQCGFSFCAFESQQQTRTCTLPRLEKLASGAAIGWRIAAGGLHVCRPFPVGLFKNADSHVAPPSDLGTAIGAGDNALIRRMGRDGESIAATLAAPERESVHVRLDRLRHDTASILVSRTTAGEEWLNGAKSILKTALVKQLPLR